MKTDNKYINWQYKLDQDNILWLAIDRPNKSANSLSQGAVLELNNIISDLNKPVNNNIIGLIIYSQKKSGFIAGADVTEFKTVKDINDARKILENGQNTFDNLAKLKIPTVAMIDGFCLGGGCELSLACDYRVASDNIKTKIGLPEVMLGIIPGWGGTVRLPRLIGAAKALPLMMQGRAVNSRQAKAMGMIDASVPIRQLKRAARYFVLNKPPKAKPGFISSLINEMPFRQIFNYFAKKQLYSKIKKEHYPAPFAILNNWLKNGVDIDSTKPFKSEIASDLDLISHATSKNLLSIFFLQEKLKEAAKYDNFDVKHVHVIGSGTMGGDIAAWCAFKGYKVTLQDRDYDSLAPALGRAYKLFLKKLKKPDLAKLCLDRLIPDINGNGIKQADVIIEAVFEDLAVKQDIFKKIEANSKNTAILATNTSSILLDEINQVMTDKSRLVGIHFFNPVAQMMLVEIVKGSVTSDDICKKASCFVNKLGKLPLPVKSSPGFLVNRVLSAYMHETFLLLSEGIAPEAIDKAMKNFGMPMGPVEMADIVGLDICLSVANNISKYYDESVPKILQDKVSAKELGKKTAVGFYKYKNGKKLKDKNKLVNQSNFNKATQSMITDRLTMRLLNICVTCLREGVVSDQDLINAGLIFGAGFAPFRGGPMEYLNTIGSDNVVNKLKELADKYNDRFKPDEGFNNLNNISNLNNKNKVNSDFKNDIKLASS